MVLKDNSTNFLLTISITCSNLGILAGQILVIGVHARRGDYSAWLRSRAKGYPVGKEFYTRGMEIFKSRFETCHKGSTDGNTNCTAVAYVVASDDLQWCKDSFGDASDVYFSPFKTRELDMAILHQCDHMLTRQKK